MTEVRGEKGENTERHNRGKSRKSHHTFIKRGWGGQLTERDAHTYSNMKRDRFYDWEWSGVLNAIYSNELASNVTPTAIQSWEILL